MRWLGKSFVIFSMLLDILFIVVALHLSAWLRPELNSLGFAKEVTTRSVPLMLYLSFPVIWVGILLLLAAYDDQRYPRLGDRLVILGVGAVLAALTMAGSLYISFREVSRLLFVNFILMALVFQFIWRSVARLFNIPSRQADVRPRLVLIVGADGAAQALGKHLKNHKDMGLEFAGILTDTSQEENGIPILGGMDEASQVIHHHHIDDVILTQPFSQQKQANELIAELHSLPVRVWLVPDYLSMTMQQAELTEFAGVPMLDLRIPVLTSYQRSLKRAFDLVFTLLSLPVLLPLMGVVAIVLRLQERGPVIFRQVRVGENGRLFEMYKFRTMITNAEELNFLVEQEDEDGNYIHKFPDDPRITRTGRFLRRTSIDELPQLFNILRGEMSLVGPRPELPHLVEKYQPWQWQRFSVPQGLTGWWQVNGRSDRPMHLNTDDDLFYIRHYSLALDAWILIRTIGVVLQGKGAF